jgi:hypothetical protein
MTKNQKLKQEERIRMLLKKVYLDHIYQRSLEQLAIREGWITKDIDGDDLRLRTGLDQRPTERNILKKKTLLLITLFENIDTDFSGLDWSWFINEGVVAEDAQMLKNLYNPLFDHDSQHVKAQDEQRIIFDHARKSAYELMKVYRNRLIQFHIRKSLQNRWSEEDYKRKLRSQFDYVLDNVFITDDDLHFLNSSSLFYLHSFASDLLRMKWNLEECIYYSCAKGTAFSTALGEPSLSKPIQTQKPIDDLYYLVRTRLTDEILILPAPKSLQGAIAMRRSKDMKRFREVISAWCESLRQGDYITEVKIRRDIHKANRELRNLKHWREYEKSPINFWLNSIGGHIPVLSNILTVIYTLGGLYSKLTEKRHNWVMLAQGTHKVQYQLTKGNEIID